MTAAIPTTQALSHRDVGADEATWLLDLRWDNVPRLDLEAVLNRCPRVVLVTAHPDDETLALGGTLAQLAEQDIDVTVVTVTVGGDGHDEIRHRLMSLVDDATLLLAPVECDGHPDSESIARVAEQVARDSGATMLAFPVWLWNRVRPADLEWTRLRLLAPPLSALQAKSHLIRAVRNRQEAPGGRVAETVLLPRSADLAARIAGDVDCGRSATEVSEPFDAMYAGDTDDPWHLEDSVYEARRLDLVLACLGRSRYGSAIDIGCASGQLAQRLTRRADNVIGVDVSSAALEIARARAPQVRWLLGAAPSAIPDQQFDLVILSEVAYFLDGPDLLTTLRKVRHGLRPGGEIVLANWRRPTQHIPLDGPTAHRQANAMLDLGVRARYEDADLLIEVWGEPTSVYDENRDE